MNVLDEYWQDFWKKKPQHLIINEEVVKLFYTYGAIAITREIANILSDDSISGDEAYEKVKKVIDDVQVTVETMNSRAKAQAS